MQKDTTTLNEIELSGIISKCVIKEHEEKTDAYLVVCTGNLHNGHLEDQMYHHVHILADGETADKLTECEQTCRDRTEGRTKNFDFIQVTGEMRTEQTPTTARLYVEADPRMTGFNARPFRNEMKLQGAVTSTISNDAYARINIWTQDRDGNDVIMPVTVPKESRQYQSIHDGKVKTGTILSMTGALISATFRNNDKNIYRCSLNTHSFRTVKLTKTKTSSMSI